AVLARHDRVAAFFDRHQRALLAPGADRAGYADAAIGPKKRKELRRQRRRLGDIGAVRCAQSAAGDIPAALQDFLALEASGWKGRAGTAVARHQDLQQFLTRAVIQLGAEKKATV